MNRISSALLRTALTASLMTAAACGSALEDSSLDPGELVGTGSEPLVLGDSVDGSVLQHRELIEVDKAKGAEPGLAGYSYSASNTNSATVNTVNYTIGLYAGEKFTSGTCGVAGATSNGDTYLRLLNPAGVEVASNDDACGVASMIAYRVPTSGIYQVRAGCFANDFCGGTLGYSIAAPVAAGNLIAGGWYYSLAVRSGGWAWAWGYNESGQLGDGTTTNRSTPVQVQGLTHVNAIAAGYQHSLAVRSDGSVWAWGSYGAGQLDYTYTPVQVQGL